MSSWLAGIVGMCVGSALGILIISLVSVTSQTERENDIYREGFAEGHRIGLRKGKALKITANQCVICGAEMPEGDQVCGYCRRKHGY
jgi:hypothetical protein